MRSVKIAFVNQPIDTILPPYQSSVGACTYGAACSLSKFSEVLAYGTRNRHKAFPAEFLERNVRFHFFSVPLSDRIAVRAKKHYCQLFPLTPPPSTSQWLYRAFGRQVAEHLRLQVCDVIHLQNCSQYLPVIRALNPTAKIVLQLHGEWYSQSRPAILQERLRYVDLVTTVSDHVTEKIRCQFPVIATRCQTMYNGVDATEFRREKDREASPRREMRILYAGAASPHKGLHVLMDAFSLVVKQYPEVRLDVVGFQASYPLAETFDFQDSELIESIYAFYAYDWISRLKAKLRLAP